VPGGREPWRAVEAGVLSLDSLNHHEKTEGKHWSSRCRSYAGLRKVPQRVLAARAPAQVSGAVVSDAASVAELPRALCSGLLRLFSLGGTPRNWVLANMDVGLLSEAGFCIPTLGDERVKDSDKSATVSSRRVSAVIAGTGQENAGRGSTAAVRPQVPSQDSPGAAAAPGPHQAGSPGKSRRPAAAQPSAEPGVHVLRQRGAGLADPGQ